MFLVKGIIEKKDGLYELPDLYSID